MHANHHQNPQSALHDQYERLRQSYAAARLDLMVEQVAGALALPLLHAPGSSAIAQIGEIAVFKIPHSDGLQFARLDGSGSAGFSASTVCIEFRDETPAGVLDSFTRQCREWLERPHIRYASSTEVEDAYLQALIHHQGERYGDQQGMNCEVQCQHANLYRAYAWMMVAVWRHLQGRFFRRPITSKGFEFDLGIGAGINGLRFLCPEDLQHRPWTDAMAFGPKRLADITQAAAAAIQPFSAPQTEGQLIEIL